MSEYLVAKGGKIGRDKLLRYFTYVARRERSLNRIIIETYRTNAKPRGIRSR